MLVKSLGLEPLTPFSAFKFKWLLDNDPLIREAMDNDRLMFGNVDSWLIWNLTGGVGGVNNHVTDVTNASRTMLMDLNVSLDQLYLMGYRKNGITAKGYPRLTQCPSLHGA